MFTKKQATINEDVLDYTNDLEDRIENGFDELTFAVFGGGTMSRRSFAGTTDASGLLKVADRFDGEGTRYIVLPNFTDVGTNTGHMALNFLGVGSFRNSNGYFIKVLRATTGEALIGVNVIGDALVVTF